MAFQLSPGVNVSEVDLTTVVPSSSTTTGGFVGNFNWGPVDQVYTVTSEDQLVKVFAKPDSNTATSFFTAANFLNYSNDLKVVRSVGSKANNASTSAVTYQLKNLNEYESTYQESGDGSNVFVAKYPGFLGNSLKVSLCDSNTTLWSSWQYKTNFESIPGSSADAVARGVTKDELHIVVVDTYGSFSGQANTILEMFPYVSKASDAKNYDGSSNYYKNVINSKSKYIWWMGHPTDDGAYADIGQSLISVSALNTPRFSELTATDHTLDGGTDDMASDSEITSSADNFNNADSVNISLIMAGETTSDVIPDYLISLAEARKDCMVFVSPKLDDVLNNVGNETTDILTTRNAITSSSYAFMDSGWKYQYDKYNDVYRWVPLNGDVAGLTARSDNERDPWFSPAGASRGQIKNVVKLAWNPSQADRNTLYLSGVNPVVTFPGEGTLLYGDKTLLNRSSAYDRINVRRLFIVIQKAIAKASRSSLFEINDEFTRAQFVNLIEPYLREIQGRRGIYDYKVVCDTTNNTPDVVDSNRFVGDIYIKPARSINFIQLNFVAVRTGVSFNEIVGRF